MKTTFTAMIGLVLLVIFTGCGASEENPVVEAKPRAVRVETITSRDLPIMVNSVGRLAPNRSVVLSAQVSGILKQYNADVGSQVDSGSTLAMLDVTDYALSLSEAEANLLAAKARQSATKNTFERTGRLLPEKAITTELFDKAEAEYKSAKAQVAQLTNMVALARRRLEKTSVLAPFEGYVTQRFVELGQNVSIGDPVMQLADMKTMRVKIYINELAYVHLDKQDPVKITVEAFSKTSIVGRVDKIGIKADACTNTFEIEILVDNPDFRLKAGLTARVAIRTEVIPDTVMIPQNSVIFREKRKEVFVVDQDNLAVARKVTLGRTVGSRVRILDGLNPDDKLVVAGGQYLKPGDKVVVTQ
jgi:RND family efflux transporter MFP subunit